MSVIKVKNIVKAEHSNDIVFSYEAKDFPHVPTTAAKDFISFQGEKANDFQLSPLTASQSGISRLREAALNERIEEDALQKLKGVQEEAYKEAHALGLIEGRELAFQEQKEIFVERIESLNGVLKSIEDMKQRLLADHETHIIRMIFELASRIALREIAADPKSILPVIQQVVGDTQSEERIAIQVALDDLKFIETIKERVGKDSEAMKRIRFEAVESIKPGGCLLETNYGSIDATIEMRVQRAWETLDDRLPKPEQRTSGEGKGEE